LALLFFLQATIASKNSSWSNITELIMDDNNPVFNQTLQIQVDRDELLQSSQPILNLTVLDWDWTKHKRPIFGVELPLEDTEGDAVTRRLDIKYCGGFFKCLG